MLVLSLERLKIGDIILETGSPSIAAATDGEFGHAAVALGRLLMVEAGKEHGVEINPFEFSTFVKGDSRLVGVPVKKGHVARVLRRKEPLPTGVMLGEAVWEAGRNYDTSRLLELKDLRPDVRNWLARRPRPPAPLGEDKWQGRFCSEVAARVLRLEAHIVSPNTLAKAAELARVDEAMVELDDSREEEHCSTLLDAVCAKLDFIRHGLAEEAVSHLRVAAAHINQSGGQISTADETPQIEEWLSEELRISLEAIKAVEELEASILGSG